MGLEEQKQTRDIGGVQYEMLPVAFGVGRQALMRLLRILSPVLSAGLRSGESNERAAAVFESLPASLGDDDIKYFAKLFGDASRFEKDGAWIPLVSENQEMHFAGRYFEFFRWLIFGCEVNFRGFFSGIMSADGAAAFLKMMPKG